MQLEVKKTVFVFDLDDTLYHEADYFISGINAVAQKMDIIFETDISSNIKHLAKNEKDLWKSICDILDLPESVKESLLWEYRLHTPEITLSDSIFNLVNYLKTNSAGMEIITDGRVITQKKKLIALGLDDLPVYISEAYGAIKPHPYRFKLVQEKYKYCDFVYIGDNPKKDFVVPNELGWVTIGIKGDDRSIHSQDISDLDKSFLPHYWLPKLEDLWYFLL